jgi:putative PIN family toxin of toxin-antitoxin system
MHSNIIAILDTNIFVSLLLGSKPCKELFNLFLDGRFNIAISEELVQELTRTLSSPKLEKVTSPNDIKELLSLLESDAILVHPHNHAKICRDPNDDFVLDCAHTANAHFIVTGDQDLLEIKSYKNTTIVTVRQLLNSLTH